MILTYRYRVKDSNCANELRRMAGSVNFVWNYCCQIQREAERRRAGNRLVKWPTAFDLIELMSGSSLDVGLLSDVMDGVARQFIVSRETQGKCPKWRSRQQGSLGWVPMKGRNFRIDPDGVLIFRKKRYRLWYSRPLPVNATIKAATFCEDARGRWYFNIQIQTLESAKKHGPSVGIDLGLHQFAALSDGRTIAMPAFYRVHEERLAQAQRRGQRRLMVALYAKVRNCRRNFLHQESTRIVREHGRIVVGDVNAAGIARTRMAKSVFDAGWTAFREMLRYKALRHGASFEVADERWTTQACSECGCLSGPKGREGLGIRQWTCEHCGASHDRDVNAARNLLAGA